MIGNRIDRLYAGELNTLMSLGMPVDDRTGVGTLSRFGTTLRFDLAEGFPLLTLKKVNFHAIVTELLWFLRGDTNTKYLHKYDVHIWDDWADEHGNLGPVYGAQWRSWPTYVEAPEKYQNPIDTVYVAGQPIDQIDRLIKGIKDNPSSRRHIVSAWNPAMLDEMALPPCHCLFQFRVGPGKTLDCQLYQRSADWFLGVPFNIASYALLTMIIARECGLEPGIFFHTFGDYHLYRNHLEQARIISNRARDHEVPMPTVVFESKPIMEYVPSDFTLLNYQPLGPIKASVAV